MAAKRTDNDTATDIARAEASAPQRAKGGEGLEDWLASLGGLFRAAGDFEPEVGANA
jgi:hypothetical protein